MKRKLISIVLITSLLLTACSTSKYDKDNVSIPTIGAIYEDETSPTPVAIEPTTPTPAITTPAAPTSAVKVESTPTPVAIATATPTKSAQDTDNSGNKADNNINKPLTVNAISDEFKEAFSSLKNKLLFDMSALKLKDSEVKLTITNKYYDVISQVPAFKYAYNVDVNYDSKTKVATCLISYMPYKTGDINADKLPAGTHKIDNLIDLMKIARESIGEKEIPIAITNSQLDVDAMQRALDQAGYGYIVYSLNNDATQLIANPTYGMTMEDCISDIDEINSMADSIISEIITNNMTSDEKTTAIYHYITIHVEYDQRYYTDRKNMPYQSQTAYGALKDNMAICGGYGWAFNVLLSKVGVECFNVVGTASGEYHFWNIAKYGDDYYYFDSTYDRAKSDYKYFAVTADEISKRTWNKEQVALIIKDAKKY